MNLAARFRKRNKGKQKTVINPYERRSLGISSESDCASSKRFSALFVCASPWIASRRNDRVTLKESDADYERRLLHVQRTFSRGKIKFPKSGKTWLVDMSARLTKVLQEMQRKPGGLMFPSPNGTMRNPSNLSKSFKQFLKDNDLRIIRLHDLRHTFATLHIKNNQFLAYIRDQMATRRSR